MLQIQLKFYHYSGSSNSESHFQVLTFQVQVQVLKKPDSSPTRVQVQNSSPSTLVLAGAPEVLLSRFQSLLNSVARLVFSANRSAHTTPLLQELHWLRVPERIQFRLCVLTYRCLNGTAPVASEWPGRLTV